MMIPIRDDNPTLHTSIITYLIIAVNVLVWIFIQKLGTNPALAASVCEFGLIPGNILNKLPSGTRVPLAENLICVIEGGPRYWTLVTSMFMHGGWLHLIGNMWFLSVFGDNVEDVMGPFRFIAFYLLCGVAAAAAQMLSNPGSPVPMVGASGAIGGVMGAYAVLFPRAPVHMLVILGFWVTRIVVPAIFMLGYWAIIQLLGGLFSSGTGGGVAFWAHMGGFAAGIFLLPVLCNSSKRKICQQKRGSVKKWVERSSRSM